MTEEKFLEPSEEFKLAVRHANSIRVECELCGRVYFTDYDSNSFEEGELEELMEQHEKEPDKYILWREDGISWGIIDGKQAVIDCQCHKLSKYENLFWDSKHIIASYFKARAEEELKSAQANNNLAKDIGSLIK